jgi:hypothetical protein
MEHDGSNRSSETQPAAASLLQKVEAGHCWNDFFLIFALYSPIMWFVFFTARTSIWFRSQCGNGCGRSCLPIDKYRSHHDSSSPDGISQLDPLGLLGSLAGIPWDLPSILGISQESQQLSPLLPGISSFFRFTARRSDSYKLTREVTPNRFRRSVGLYMIGAIRE